jgi:hypothetical protein
MVAAMTSFEESSAYWGMFPTLAFEDAVTVTGGCLKRGAQVAVRRFHGRLFVLVENSEWVSQAALGASRSRSGIRRTCSIDKLRECAIERAQMAVVPLSALEDDPMKELEQHYESGALGPPPSKRRRLPLAGLPPACVRVPAHLVAPLARGHPPEDVAFEVCVVPRPTTRLAIFVLSSQVPALIAHVRYELMERTTENGCA